jgi:hypothetical protein
MTRDRLVSFRYEDVLRLERNGRRPPGYTRTILNSARRRGPDIVMTYDAYQAFQARYSPSQTAAALSHPTSTKLISTPVTHPKPLLGPTGLPLQSSCCKKTKALLSA